jgi:glycosyltransferase involved in cell wall biosynthesis
MYNDKKIAVVVPAYNEERLIGKTLSTMPSFVDTIVVINDGSSDSTGSLVEQAIQKDSRIVHIENQQNLGLGKSIIEGYKKAHELMADIIAVMAGDAQMDPDDLENIIQPIIEEKALYVKGNRLLSPGAFQIMPKYRFFGNAILTMLTKFATGYFHLMDPQCGYTAINSSALKYLDSEKPHEGYGYNAHLLYQLNLRNAKVVDVYVKPVYGEAVSGIKLSRYIPSVSYLLIKIFFKRVILKYFLFDFHPVGLCYFFCIFSGLIATESIISVTTARFQLIGNLPVELLPSIMLMVLSSFCTIIFGLFGMFLDIEYLRTKEKLS